MYDVDVIRTKPFMESLCYLRDQPITPRSEVAVMFLEIDIPSSVFEQVHFLIESYDLPYD